MELDCRSMESAIKLVERFIAGVTKPARFSTPEAETNPHQYDGPPRTAKQVAAAVRPPRPRSGIFSAREPDPPIWVSLVRNGRVVSDWLGRTAHWLHWLGKWSMLEVFVAGLLCVLLKLGTITRFKIESGMYWFFAAVFLSLVNAHWTEKTLRQHNRKITNEF